MANNVVTLEVISRLGKVSEELNRLADLAKNSGEALSDFGKKAGESTGKQIQNTSTFLGKLRQLSRNVRDAMVDDFKAMASIVGVSEGLKLGNQFRKAIADTIALAGTIRKLGHVFGIGKNDFASFQESISRGLGEIGLSAIATQNALIGLSETQVRGEKELTEYAKTAGELASVGREKGREGEIAKGLSGVMRETGRQPTDLAAMREVAESVRKAVSQTGAAPTEVLSSLQNILSKMPQDMRKAITPAGLTNLGMLQSTAGQGAAQFLEHYLSLAPTERMPLEAMGFKDIFSEQGLNIEKFKAGAEKLFAAHPKDPRLMAQLLGVSEQAAEGFVRLYENLDRVKSAQERVISDQRKLRDVYWESMTAGEAFEASLNRVRATLAKPVSIMIQTATEKLQKAAQSETGAALVTGGSVVLASLLFGRGLQGLLSLGRGKVTGIGERVAYEQLTGREAQDVYVVNAQEIGQAAGGLGGLAGAAPAAAGGLGAMLGKGLLLGASAFAGYEAGKMINEGIQGTALDEGINKIVDSIADTFLGVFDPEYRFERAEAQAQAQIKHQPVIEKPTANTAIREQSTSEVKERLRAQMERTFPGYKPPSQVAPIQPTRLEVAVEVTKKPDDLKVRAYERLNRGVQQ